MPTTPLAQHRAIPSDAQLLDRLQREEECLRGSKIVDDANRLPLRAGPLLNRPRGVRINVRPAVRAFPERYRPQAALRFRPALVASSGPVLQRLFITYRSIVAQELSLWPLRHPYGKGRRTPKRPGARSIDLAPGR